MNRLQAFTMEYKLKISSKTRLSRKALLSISDLRKFEERGSKNVNAVLRHLLGLPKADLEISSG